MSKIFSPHLVNAHPVVKRNPSHGLNTEVSSGKEGECTRELRSTVTRKRSSFSSPTISSSRKIGQKDRPSQPTTTHTKSCAPWRTSSKPQLLHQKTQYKAPVFQSKIQKSPTSKPPLVSPGLWQETRVFLPPSGSLTHPQVPMGLQEIERATREMKSPSIIFLGKMNIMMTLSLPFSQVLLFCYVDILFMLYAWVALPLKKARM